MKITSARFVCSVHNLKQSPRETLPQIAFAGRSNVGKSKLINCLLNRKNLAKISSTPGKTRQLNFYCINEQFYFVDLPGYGYAKVSQSEKKAWKTLIESFLRGSLYLKGVIEIIDSRHGPTDLDLQMIQWLKSWRIETLVVATKADKLSKSQLNQQIKKSLEKLHPLGISEMIPFSATTGLGKRELWKSINHLLKFESDYE